MTQRSRRDRAIRRNSDGEPIVWAKMSGPSGSCTLPPTMAADRKVWEDVFLGGDLGVQFHYCCKTYAKKWNPILPSSLHAVKSSTLEDSSQCAKGDGCKRVLTSKRSRSSQLFQATWVLLVRLVSTGREGCLFSSCLGVLPQIGAGLSVFPSQVGCATPDKTC